MYFENSNIFLKVFSLQVCSSGVQLNCSWFEQTKKLREILK